MPCRLAQYDRWVSEGVDITSLSQTKPYSGQTGPGTIVFWTTREQMPVASTAVSTRWCETVYAKVLPRLHIQESSVTVFEGFIHTAPQFRREGVAARQQAFLRRVLGEHGFRQMFVYVVSDNVASRRLQESAGAIIVAEGCLVEFPVFARSSLRLSRWVTHRLVVRTLRHLSSSS
jgi:hypothetical protein